MSMLSMLLSLQSSYIELVVNEDPQHVEVLQEYLDLVESLKDNIRRESMKFAKNLIQDSRFSEAFVTRSASLYIPVLSLLQMMFRGHRHLAVALLVKERPTVSFASTFREVTDHMLLAHDSLCEDLYPEDEPSSKSSPTILYGFEEAMIILDISIKWIKSLLDNDPESKIPSALVNLYHKIGICMSKCAILINSPDLEALSDLFNKAREEKAAITIQNFWRSVLVAKSWVKMKRGFKLFQTAYKDRLKAREAKVATALEESEKLFNDTLEAMRKQRMDTERTYQELLKTPANSLLNMEKFDPVTEADKMELKDESAVDSKIEGAVLVIQYHLRRWLVRRRNKFDFSRTYMQHNQNLTEERVAKIQEEIENWQQKNRVNCSLSEMSELHQRAQSGISKFYHSIAAIKRREQKTAVTIAQTKVILSLLETAPSLADCTQDQCHKFHSLPLHTAIKARLDHQEAMNRLQMPSWKRILSEFG